MGLVRKTLESGAVLELGMAPFKDGHVLFRAVMKEAGDIPLDDAGRPNRKDLAVRMLSSETIELTLWPCMVRSTYNGQKIVPETFENEEVRGDFLAVAMEVMVYNLGPFFKSLGALSPAREESNTASQKAA